MAAMRAATVHAGRAFHRVSTRMVLDAIFWHRARPDLSTFMQLQVTELLLVGGPSWVVQRRILPRSPQKLLAALHIVRRSGFARGAFLTTTDDRCLALRERHAPTWRHPFGAAGSIERGA